MKKMKKTAVLFALLLSAAVLASCRRSSGLPEEPDGFTFSLTWGCYGISSYDSSTGQLVKTTDASNPEDYVTTCRLTAEELSQIYDILRELDVESYPDTYNPHKNGLASVPPMTLILTVRTNTIQKTITAENIAYTDGADNAKGQAFLDACREIRDILTATDEWKALPEYEVIYD